MYSILIVEDEEIERNSLVAMIAKSVLLIEHIYCAQDGVEALEQYEKYMPDIIVLDIQLPRMNGIACAKQIKKLAKHKNVRFIIQTSHGKFSYAQECIRIGVDDFIVKPTPPQRIISSIAKIIDTYQVEKNIVEQTAALINKVDYMKKTLEVECLKLILTNQNERMIQSLLSLLGKKIKSGFCIYIKDFVLSEKQQEAMKSDIADVGYFALMDQYNLDFVIFVLHAGIMDMNEVSGIQEVLRKYHIFLYEVGLGTICRSIENLYTSYVYASTCTMKRNEEDFYLYDLDFVKEHEQEVNCKTWVNEFILLFKTHNDMQFQQTIHQFSECLLTLRADDINRLMDDFTMYMERELHHSYQIDYVDSAIKRMRIHEENKYQILEIQIVYMINSLFTPVKNLRYQKVNPLTKRAVKFMQTNYNKPISLFDVAKELDISPFYVSKLLNKELHKTFTDFVNEIRIEQAKHLLKEHHTVKEISGEIGFRNPGYFAKIFKKIVGVTPSEYRDLFL